MGTIQRNTIKPASFSLGHLFKAALSAVKSVTIPGIEAPSGSNTLKHRNTKYENKGNTETQKFSFIGKTYCGLRATSGFGYFKNRTTGDVVYKPIDNVGGDQGCPFSYHGAKYFLTE